MADKKNVLVAEDSSVIQNLTRKILEIQNYTIHAAKDGKKVLEKLKSDDFDIILMDINMPLMDGMECAKEIRGMDDPKKSQIPIIAISGNAKNYTEDDFKAVGINEFLPKPLDFDNLVDVVKKYTK
ncbi:MAG TPA: histidine kinase [Cytophagales bacterium]|nr:histidine kinase [Cytophagales bacterium]HAA18753.1 histidine kinase [Cytophagales bacterium]HAP63149.1 histidine kinase [Cytophagales bacterium]